MSDTQKTADLIELIRAVVTSPQGSTLEGREGIDRMATLLTEAAHPDFVTEMVSKGGIGTEYAGIAGFRKALTDWISPYERFRLEIDEVITDADRLIILARQVGTTRHDGVEIETPSATIWALADGRIRRATFYIDQRAALEAAGIDPTSR